MEDEKEKDMMWSYHSKTDGDGDRQRTLSARSEKLMGTKITYPTRTRCNSFQRACTRPGELEPNYITRQIPTADG